MFHARLLVAVSIGGLVALAGSVVGVTYAVAEPPPGTGVPAVTPQEPEGRAAGPMPNGEPPERSGRMAGEGYVGPALPDSGKGALTVVDGSLHRTSAGAFMVQGLVGNGSSATVDVDVVITARDAAGSVLFRSSARVFVGGIRPTESAPFRLKTETPATDVVDFNIEVARKPGRAVTRRSAITPFWTAPYGERPSITSGYPVDETHAQVPRPALVLGSYRNLEKRAVQPKVVVAWFSDSGALLRIDEAVLLDGSPVSAGASRDFLVSMDDPQVAAASNVDTLAFWGSADA